MTSAACRLFLTLALVAAAVIGFVARDPSRDPARDMSRTAATLPVSGIPAPTSTFPPSTEVVADPVPRGIPRTTVEESRDFSRAPRHTTTTTTTTPPTTAEANDVAAHGVWQATGERRATSSTVYCVSGLTYSGGQTHTGRHDVGRTAAVNRDNGEWEQYAGTTWRVVTGPEAGAIYTIEDAGTAAHFDMWHGDRADCRSYALDFYGVRDIVVERVEHVPA